MRGVVLAGGKSSRFGSDKALAVYQDEFFLRRAVRILTELKLDPVVVTREGISYSVPDSAILYDYLPEKGPLGGIYTVMRKFPGDDLLVLTCDMPALGEKALLGLIEEYKKNPALTLYRSVSTKIEPFPGIYPYGLFPEIFKNILTEKLAMHQLIQPVFEKNIVSFGGSSKALMNVNNQTDLKILNT